MGDDLGRVFLDDDPSINDNDIVPELPPPPPPRNQEVAIRELRAAMEDGRFNDADEILPAITNYDDGGLAQLLETTRKLLHKSTMDYQFLRRLVEAIPALTRTVEHRWSLLHMVCRYGSNDVDLDTLQFLVQLHPKATSTADDGRGLPFHRLLEGGVRSLRKVQLLLSCYPEAIRIPCHEDRLFPLHVALKSGKVSLEIIEYLLIAYPETATDKTSLDEAPLHFACNYCWRREVIQLLLDADPEGRRLRTTHGDTALHLACRRNAPYRIVKLLVDAFPDAVQTKNDLEDLPLHELVGGDPNNASLQAIQLLMDRHPDPRSIQAKDQGGRLPLHLAALVSSAETLQFILDSYPEGLFVSDHRGHLPLHYASCTCEASLFDPRRGVVYKHSAYGSLPFRKSSLRQVKLLVEADPNSVLPKIRNGIWPYQFALRHRVGWVDGDDDAAVVNYLVDKTERALVELGMESFVGRRPETGETVRLQEDVVVEVWKFVVPNNLFKSRSSR